MLASAGLALYLAMQAPKQETKSFIPTSDVIDVARMVARGLGYSLADRTKYFFDLLPGPKGEPLFPGYVTVGFYWNSNTVNAISINEKTGQVLDITMCTWFEFPTIKRFERSVQRGTGLPPLTEQKIRAQTGCESVKKLTVPQNKP